MSANYTLIFCLILFVFLLIYVFTRFKIQFKAVSDTFKKTNNFLLNKKIYLFVILFIGFILRIYKLSVCPLGIYSDEASIGYNAYSISETLHDEHGEFLPVYFKAFGEYKNPVFIYFTTFILKIFGLNIFSVRFSSVILSLITVFFTYKVAKLYFNEKAGLISAFLLAISPWSIQYARFAGDASSINAFFLLGFYLFSKGVIKNDKKAIIFSSIPIAITFYCYAIAKLFTPLFYFIYFLLNFKKIKNFKKEICIWFVLVSIMFFPILKTTFEKDIQSRFNMLSITNEGLFLREKREKIRKSNLSFLAQPDPVLLSTVFVENYFKHMSLDFFLHNGDRNPRHNIPGRGELLEVTFCFCIIGFIYLLLKREIDNYIFLVWLLIFPVPVSLTWESLPHSARSICGIPVFEILAGIGLYKLIAYLINVFHTKKIKTLLLTSLLLMIFLRGIIDYNSYIKSYINFYGNNTYAGFDYPLYMISEKTGKMKDFDYFIIPEPFAETTFFFIQKVNPRIVQEKNKKGEVYKYLNEKVDLEKYRNKSIAKLIPPAQDHSGVTVGKVYNEVYNTQIYTIKKLFNGTLNAWVSDRSLKTEGFIGKYYQGKDFDELKMTRFDKEIDFDWGEGSPSPQIENDKFSVNWKGWINLPKDGKYEFNLDVDDWALLAVDDVIVIDDWTPNTETKYSKGLNLLMGWHKIELFYNEDVRDSRIKLAVSNLSN